MKTKNTIKSLIPWIWFIAVSIIFIIFYSTHIGKLVDSDMASEMILAKHLNQEKLIISKYWAYSTEIRVLNNQMLFQFFLIFTKNMLLVRIISGITLAVLLELSFLYMLRSMNMAKLFPYLGAFLLIPFSKLYSDIVLLGLYYYPHIIISFLSVGLVFSIDRERKDATSDESNNILYIRNKKSFVIRSIILFLLSFVAGLGGLRQIVVCYLPLVLTALLYFYKNKKIGYIGAYISLIAGGAGAFVNSHILQKRYDFNAWDAINFRWFSFDNFGNILKGIFACLGFADGQVYSFALWQNIGFFVVFTCIILYLIYVHRNGEKISEIQWFATALFLIMLLTYLLLYLFTDMFYSDRYALPLVVFVLPVFGCAIKYHNWKRASTIIITIVIGGLLLFSSNGVYKLYTNIDKTSELRKIGNMLVEQGYDIGYATYWNANILSEVSDGKISMIAWENSESSADVQNTYKWLVDKRKLKYAPSGKLFILLHGDEIIGGPIIKNAKKEDYIYESEDYIVLGYDSYDDMIYKLSYIDYDLNKEDYLTGGESVNGKWNLFPGGYISGREFTIYPGVYYITIEGYGPNLLSVSVVADRGETALTIIPQEITTDKAVYAIDVDKTYIVCDLIIQNLSGEVIRLDNIAVEKVE